MRIYYENIFALVQVCSAGSRLLIQESIFDELISRLKLRMSRLRIGHCLDKTIDMGAVVDDSQRRSVDDLVQSARSEGAEVLTCSNIGYELSYMTTLCFQQSFMCNI